MDIKSKPLRDALIHVMGAVKGVSFAEETPVVDPNMLFLYLEEMRTHMKELKAKSKSEKKKKAKKVAAAKAAHVKVLIKYLDKDYAETKKTLYPLLESNTITSICYGLCSRAMKSPTVQRIQTQTSQGHLRSNTLRRYAHIIVPAILLCNPDLTQPIGIFFHERHLVQYRGSLSRIRR